MLPHTNNISQQYVAMTASHFKPPPLAFEVLHIAGQPFATHAQKRPKQGLKQQCFYNAFHLAIETGLHYVEGYAVAGHLPLPLEHAWCVDDAGLIYDPTWDNGTHYFGMAFQPQQLEAIHHITDVHSVFSNLWRLRCMTLPEIRQLLLDAAHPITA